MSGRIVTCAFCGQAYPAGTPSHGAEILNEHIKLCISHPIRGVERQVKLLRSALIGLIGAEDVDELLAIEAVMRIAAMPDKDRSDAINAVHALIETDPGK